MLLSAKKLIIITQETGEMLMDLLAKEVNRMPVGWYAILILLLVVSIALFTWQRLSMKKTKKNSNRVTPPTRREGTRSGQKSSSSFRGSDDENRLL